jgi:hypothetical protein
MSTPSSLYKTSDIERTYQRMLSSVRQSRYYSCSTERCKETKDFFEEESVQTEMS